MRVNEKDLLKLAKDLNKIIETLQADLPEKQLPLNLPVQAVKHLTTEELAKRLGHSPTTLADWRWKGGGPRYVKLGRKVCYRVEDVEKWETSKLKKNTEE